MQLTVLAAVSAQANNHLGTSKQYLGTSNLQLWVFPFIHRLSGDCRVSHPSQTVEMICFVPFAVEARDKDPTTGGHWFILQTKPTWIRIMFCSCTSTVLFVIAIKKTLIYTKKYTHTSLGLHKVCTVWTCGLSTMFCLTQWALDRHQPPPRHSKGKHG